MGQKVTPTGFRLGITYKPQSRWFVDPRNGFMKKIYPPLLLEDKFIRDFINNKFPRTAIAQILINRTYDYTKIEIHTAQAKKLSYQSAAFGSQKSSSKSNKNDHFEKESENQNDEKASVGPTEYNVSLKSTNSNSHLKNLQQDLQTALLKYRKTLRIFSSWKHDSYKIQTGNSIENKSNENDSLPKLWSYETSEESTRKKNSSKDASNKEPDFLNAEESLDFLENDTSKALPTIGIIIKQLNQPFQYAPIFAKYLVSQLERRENTVKQALNRSLKLINNANIQGIKIKVSGRLNGGDMAEQEIISKGRIPLSTIDANIDYYQDTAQTLYGTLGVKVFIFRG